MNVITTLHQYKVEEWRGVPVAKFRVSPLSERRWIARPLLWLLRKAGITLWEPYQSVKTIEIQPDDLIAAIRLEVKDLYQLGIDHAGTLLVGVDVFERFLSQEINQPLAFDHKINVVQGGPPSSPSLYVFNLRVVLCPWITGWCILPKEVFA